MIPYFEWRTFDIGPIPIQVWGFWVALGIGVGMWLLVRRLKAYKINPESVLDLGTYLVFGGFIGARLFHVFLYEPAQYLVNPIEILYVWHGGLSSFGGFAGALFALWLFKKRKGFAWLKRVPMVKLLDELSQALLVGWIIGRVGCVMIHDHPGAPCGCVLDLKGNPAGDRMDMAMLEIFALLPLAVLFFVLRKRGVKMQGVFLYVLMAYYGVVRFILDFWRSTDLTHSDVRYFGLTPAQYLSMVMTVYGVYGMVKKGKIDDD